MRGPLWQREQEAVQRKAQHEIERGPDEARIAPTHCVVQERRYWPAQSRCETRKERDAGDGAARIAAVKGSQRGKSSIVEAERHADAENRPGAEETGGSGCGGECEESAGQDHVGKHED